MAWYKTGTITVTNGSTTVIGSGTQWILNAEVGEALYINEQLYEITNIASDTALTIAPAYLGTTAAGQAYVIVPSQSYIRDLAEQAADLVNQYSTIAAFAGQGKFGDGTLAAPGIRYSDDLDTGFFRSAANEVTFVAGGVAQFKYNASGVSFITGGALVGTTATQTLTNKTIAFASNTLTDVASTSTAQTLTNKTLTSPVVNTPNLTGGTINNATIGASTPSTVASTNLSYTGTLTGGTGVINIGSGQVFKDASGNVGINTSDPQSKLQVIGDQIVVSAATALSNIGIQIKGTAIDAIPAAQAQGYIATGSSSMGANGDLLIASRTNAATSIRFVTGTTPAERLRITDTGRVGINTASPSETLDVNGTIQGGFITSTGSIHATTGIFRSSDGTAASPSIQPGLDNDTGFFRAASNVIGFSTAGSERARIDASGNLLVGTTGSLINSTNFGVAIKESNQILASRNTASAVAQFYGSTGENRFLGTGAIQNTLNSYGAISDIKLKENIVDATPKLDKLNQVRIVNFNLIGSEQKQIGVVAQELEQIFPSMVDNNQDEDSEGNPTGETTKSVKYSVFVPMLIKAIQELSAKVDTLQAELNTLKGN